VRLLPPNFLPSRHLSRHELPYHRGVLLIVARDEPMRGGGAFRGAAVDDSAVVTGRRGLVVSPRGGGVHDTSGHPLRCD
tara:strand:- start:1589 stop:1825 length:237 start_codon:yes stop_codon:yes gene_type:complete